jgi:predicted HAD superfamily hydrolase
LEDESEPSFSATSASAYNTSRLLSMVQSIRDQQLEVLPLLNEIAHQQRDSDLVLKAVLSELQLLKSKVMPQQSQDTYL